MNKRLYGLLSLPMVINGPYHVQELKFNGRKKSTVRGRRVGCDKCGASRCTLRKLKVGFGLDSKERLLCPKCYAKESKNA